jgi:nucleoside transporter
MDGSMSFSLRSRLSILMFLQYAILGLWAVVLPTFLKSPPNMGGLALPARDVGLLYGTLALGATVAPLFVGLLADRLFATQRVLAVLHFMGALLLVAAAYTCEKQRDEVAFTFDQLAMAEPVADAELWRFLWEKESLERYLADPAGYRQGPPPLPPHVQRVFNWLGISLRRYTSVDHPPVWGGPDAGRQRLSELDQLIKPALTRVLASPELLESARRLVPALFAILLGYSCCYVATITLANALTFRNLPDPAHQFGQVRALGTVGWIAAGIFVGVFLPAISPLPLIAGALASLGLSIFALFLPHTPPAGKPRTLGDALGLPALKMMADRSFLVFILTAVASSFLMAFHNVFTNPFLVDLGVPIAAAAQTLGQYTEVAGILLIPIVRRWIGTKRLLLVGLIASAARFVGYASQTWPGVLAIGLPLHGIGFSFFYITAAIYIDQQAPQDLRASAQGLVTLLTVGAGALLGNWFSGRVVDWNTTGGTVDWGRVWMVPAIGTLVAACGFALLFREPVRQPPVPDEIVPDVEMPGA